MLARSDVIRWMAWVPNALSVLRLVLAAMFPMFEGLWRAAVIVVVAVSDAADGFIARRFDAATWIGGLLDSIADKVFVIIVLATYLAEGELAPGEVALLLARDVVVLSVVAYVGAMRLWSGLKRMPARLLGKITTGAMFVLILLVALTGEERGPWVTAALLVTTAFSVAAAADYLVLFIRGEWARRRGEPHLGQGG